MLEKSIEKKLRNVIEAAGGKCLKFESPGFTGVPDRIILLPGCHVLFAETKKPGDKERARQKYVHSILRKLGFTVYNTVDSIEKVKQIEHDCVRLMQNENI